MFIGGKSMATENMNSKEENKNDIEKDITKDKQKKQDAEIKKPASKQKSTEKKTSTSNASSKKTTSTKSTTKKESTKKSPSTKSAAKKDSSKKITPKTDKKKSKETSNKNKLSATEKAAQAAKEAKSSGIKKKSKAAKTKNTKENKIESKKNKKEKRSIRSFFFTDEKKKKAPKLVEPKDVKKDARSATAQKHYERKIRRMRGRAIGLCAICVAVLVLVLGGFKIAGALEINGGQAGKVGDKYITENELTDYIKNQTYFKQYAKNLSGFAQYLGMYGMTAEKFREQALEDKFFHEELVRLACEKEEIEIDDATVDEHVNSFKSKYDNDNNYKKALETAGYTEESYWKNTKQTLLEKALIEKVITVDPPTDDDVKTYLTSYSTSYKDARRSSHILFDAKDKDNAQKVLDQIKAGTLTFEDAVVQYSKDEATKPKAGDRGWDKIESFTSAYNSGLSGLNAGAVCAELVTDKEGIHIIKCTEKWDTPDTIESLDGVPPAIIEECRKKKNESNQATELKTWLETFADENGIETSVFPMPDSLIYNVQPSSTINSSTVGSM